VAASDCLTFGYKGRSYLPQIREPPHNLITDGLKIVALRLFVTNVVLFGGRKLLMTLRVRHRLSIAIDCHKKLTL